MADGGSAVAAIISGNRIALRRQPALRVIEIEGRVTTRLGFGEDFAKAVIGEGSCPAAQMAAIARRSGHGRQ